MPNGRCRMHGGKSLIGVDSPTYKHGLYSRDLLTRLGAITEHAPQLALRLIYLPEREAMRVALVYKNEGKEAAWGRLADLTIKRLERRYGSIEAAEAAVLGRGRRRR